MNKIAMLTLLGLGLVGCGPAATPAPSNTPPAAAELSPGAPDNAAPVTPPTDAAPPAAATPEAK